MWIRAAGVRKRSGQCGKEMRLDEGYYLDWTGEYESQQRANRRLAVIVPITLLLMSFFIPPSIPGNGSASSSLSLGSLRSVVS